MESICIRIKELRKELEMSQVAFANELGVTNAHISKIEKGKTVPSEALIKLISKEYQVNENWLKNGVEPIFIYDLVEKTEEQLSDSTVKFSKLLQSDSDIIRYIASDLKLCFSNITDVEGLEEETKIEYLTLLKEMLNIMNNYNNFIKDNIYSKQYILDNIIEDHFENYKKEMVNCINQYKKFINK